MDCRFRWNGIIIILFNHGVKYLSCMTDVFTKYAWVKPLKNKKAETVLRGFIGMANESKHKTK